MAAIPGLASLWFWPGSAAPSLSNFPLNQTTDALEFIFQSQAADPITRLGFRQGALTGTAPVIRVSLQGVDASGNPDGVTKAAGLAYADYTPTVGNTSSWLWLTLGAAYTPARGEHLALVIAHQSGTIDGSNNCTFTSTILVTLNSSLPYAITNDAGTRTRQTASPCFGWGTATEAFGAPAVAAVTDSYNSGSSPDERALLLTIPATFCTTYKIAGVTWFGSVTAGSTYDVVLYDTDGATVLQSTTFDTDVSRLVGSSVRPCLFDTTTLATLQAGSTYRISIKPAGTNVGIARVSVASAADLEAYPFGSWARGSSRTDGGAWTDSDVTRYGINPILADVTAPSGGGGVLAYPLTGRA